MFPVHCLFTASHGQICILLLDAISYRKELTSSIGSSQRCRQRSGDLFYDELTLRKRFCLLGFAEAWEPASERNQFSHGERQTLQADLPDNAKLAADWAYMLHNQVKDGNGFYDACVTLAHAHIMRGDFASAMRYTNEAAALHNGT